MALFDAFLKLDGIKGESADAKHKGEIDIYSFSARHQRRVGRRQAQRRNRYLQLQLGNGPDWGFGNRRGRWRGEGKSARLLHYEEDRRRLAVTDAELRQRRAH